MSKPKTLTATDDSGNVSLVSESGRTTVTAAFDNYGKGSVTLTRDGKVVYRHDLPREENPE